MGLFFSIVDMGFLILDFIRNSSWIDLVSIIVLILFNRRSNLGILWIFWLRLWFPILIRLWRLFTFIFSIFHNGGGGVVNFFFSDAHLISKVVMLHEQQVTVFYLLLPLYVRWLTDSILFGFFCNRFLSLGLASSGSVIFGLLFLEFLGINGIRTHLLIGWNLW